MRSTLLRRDAAGSTFLLVFDPEDEVMATLLDWARNSGVQGASFTGIGAFRRAVVGFFDLERRDYERIAIDEQVEVLALTGNIGRAGDEPKVHAHVVLGTRAGMARGGHLLEAVVRPTLELVVVEADETMRRTHDDRTGLPLLEPRSH